MNLIPSLAFVGAGLGIILLAIPLIRRKVRPNPIYGLRVPATFADEWVWYEANARSGRDMVVYGAMLAVIALVVGALPISAAVFAVITAGVALAGALVMAVAGWRRANRLLAERRAGGAR